MSSVADVSSKLGDYMLKGWVLTDQSCKTPGCSVPLMRSPTGRTPVVLFCANCDDNPGVPRPTINASASTSSLTSQSHMSRSSTPPTEVSSTLSSPVFAPPADTEETRRRREQSDRASSEIGKRLLKGWAMLGDECPNTRCYGVPLVRPPKAGGEKDPRKECVICGGVYVTEVDWAGRESLIPAADADAGQHDNHISAPISDIPQTPPPQERYHVPSLGQEPVIIAPSAASTAAVYQQPERSLVQIGNPLHALEESSLSLQSTLKSLSARLGTLSSHTGTDPSSIGLTADAIGKVTQALSQVRALQWSESQAQIQRL